MKFYFLSLIVTFSGGLAQAGAVSGGGGGTTNPSPVDPELVAESIRHYAGPVLLMWLNQEESNYLNLSQDKKQNSPFRKLFEGERDIFSLLLTTKVELNMASPCKDAFGHPKDGSMHASQTGSICISPFTMGPKLNEYNVEAETLALVMHEISHLVGTTEEEAEVIQLALLNRLMRMDLLDILAGLESLTNPNMSDLPDLIRQLEFSVHVAPTLQSGAIESFQNGLLAVREKLTRQFLKLQFLREETFIRFTPQFGKTDAVKEYLCSRELPPFQTEESRADCAERLKRGYGNDEIMTSRQFTSRHQQTNPDLYDRGYDLVLLKRITSLEGVKSELSEVNSYLKFVLNELVQLKDSRMTTK